MTGHCEECSCSIGHSRDICFNGDCSFCKLPPRKHGYNEEAFYAKMKRDHVRDQEFKKNR